MNDKDKEAFEKWMQYEDRHDGVFGNNNNFTRDEWVADKAWQAACEYKQKDIDELKVEISRLVNCVEFYATTGILNDEHDFFILKDFKISVPTTRRARQLMQIYSNIYTKHEE